MTHSHVLDVVTKMSSNYTIKIIPYYMIKMCIVGYHKKGYPKQEPKLLLKPCKNQSQRTTTRYRPNSSIRPRLAPRPQMKGQSPPPRRGPLAEAPPRPARPRTGCQFSDSPEAGLGNNLVASVPTDSPDKTSRPVNAPHYSRNVSRTSALYRQND